MRRRQLDHSTKLVIAERRRWQDNHLLAPGALRDFQQLSDEAFSSMRDKYYRPADLIADVQLRRHFRLKQDGTPTEMEGEFTVCWAHDPDRRPG